MKEKKNMLELLDALQYVCIEGSKPEPDQMLMK